MKFPIRLSVGEIKTSDAPDVNTALEQERLKSAQLETKLKETTLWTGRADLAGRGFFSLVVFGLMIWWLNFVREIVTAVAFNHAHLSDAVLIALVTTTTANVLGLWVIVANYLYQKGKLVEAAKDAAKTDTEPPKAS